MSGKARKTPKESNFKELVRQLVKNKDESEWREQMQKKDKLVTYRKLKTNLVLEDYVIELGREQRRKLTMLRGGTNKLKNRNRKKTRRKKRGKNM